MVYYFSWGCSVAASSFDNFGPRSQVACGWSRSHDLLNTTHKCARPLNTVHNRAKHTHFNFNNYFIILTGQGVVHNYQHLWKRTQLTLGGRGSGTTVRFFPQKSTFNFNHWQCIIKYTTCLESGLYAHICRSFMYNSTFEALFLTSKCMQSDFLWTQTVASTLRFLYGRTEALSLRLRWL